MNKIRQVTQSFESDPQLAIPLRITYLTFFTNVLSNPLTKTVVYPSFPPFKKKQSNDEFTTYFCATVPLTPGSHTLLHYYLLVQFLLIFANGDL